jgi:hypothetical protein
LENWVLLFTKEEEFCKFPFEFPDRFCKLENKFGLEFEELTAEFGALKFNDKEFPPLGMYKLFKPEFEDPDKFDEFIFCKEDVFKEF